MQTLIVKLTYQCKHLHFDWLKHFVVEQLERRRPDYKNKSTVEAPYGWSRYDSLMFHIS